MPVDDDVNESLDLTETPRPSFWKVGLGLLSLVLVIVVGAFLLDQHLRPTVGIEPAATANVVLGKTSLPTAIVSGSTATPTATPAGGLQVGNSPLEREIEAAYLRYWQVLTRAYLELDTSQLAEVMAGDELIRTEQQIQQLKAQGRAAKLDVVHQTAFVKVAPDSAIVYDQYLNRSVFMDAATKEELKTSQPPTTEKLSFHMEKVGGVWKVVEGVRHD
jgi:hypothetical protein